MKRTSGGKQLSSVFVFQDQVYIGHLGCLPALLVSVWVWRTVPRPMHMSILCPSGVREGWKPLTGLWFMFSCNSRVNWAWFAQTPWSHDFLDQPLVLEGRVYFRASFFLPSSLSGCEDGKHLTWYFPYLFCWLKSFLSPLTILLA